MNEQFLATKYFSVAHWLLKAAITKNKEQIKIIYYDQTQPPSRTRNKLLQVHITGGMHTVAGPSTAALFQRLLCTPFN